MQICLEQLVGRYVRAYVYLVKPNDASLIVEPRRRQVKKKEIGCLPRDKNLVTAHTVRYKSAWAWQVGIS